jgi:hypothetical protein
MEYAVEWQVAGILGVAPNDCLIREILHAVMSSKFPLVRKNHTNLEKLLGGAVDRLNLFHGYEASKEFTFENYPRPITEAGWLQVVDSAKLQGLREMARFLRQSDDSIQEPTFVPSF